MNFKKFSHKLSTNIYLTFIFYPIIFNSYETKILYLLSEWKKIIDLYLYFNFSYKYQK